MFHFSSDSLSVIRPEWALSNQAADKEAACKAFSLREKEIKRMYQAIPSDIKKNLKKR